MFKDSDQWIFRPPFPRALGILGNTLSRYLIPKFLLSAMFRDWPPAQVNVLHTLVVSGPCIAATLSMANDEMLMIRELDEATLYENKRKIWMFLADRDDWVGEENKQTIVQAMADEPENIRIVHGRFGIPHAYCISAFFRNNRMNIFDGYRFRSLKRARRTVP